MTPNPKETQSRRDWIALAAILVLAAALRIIGLRWGLPNELHSYSYHPDEFLTVGSSAHMAGLIDGHRTINPGFYNYPSLYLYLSSLAMMVASGYGWLAGDQNIYLAARIITVLMSIGSVAAVYWAGRTMFGATAGLLAALVMAIAPIHVQHSHFATVDVPSTLPVALCLGYAALILKRGSWRDYILAGIMAGLACGTKYNAVLVIFAPIAAHFLSDARSGASFGLKTTIHNPKLYLVPIIAIAAFIISTPGSLLYSNQFLSAINYERLHQSAGHGLVFVGTGNGFWYTFRSSLWFGFGFGFAVMFIAAAVWGLWKRDKRALLLIAFALPYYVLISMSQVRFARYTLPLLPAASLLICWLIVEWYTALAKAYPLSRMAWLGVLIFTFFCTYVYTDMINGMFLGSDPRDKAAQWIKEWVPQGSSIGMQDYPWYYSPPLTKSIGMGTLDMRQNATRKAPYKITVFSDYAKAGEWWAKGQRPEWVISIPEETRDAERLSGRKDIPEDDRRAVEKTLGDVYYVRSHYDLPRPSGGMFQPHFYQYHEYTGPYNVLPHDMRYPLSTVYILRLTR